MIQKKTLNLIKEPLACSKKNIEENQLLRYVLRCILLKVLTMKIRNINLVQKAYKKTKMILLKNDLKKY